MKGRPTRPSSSFLSAEDTNLSTGRFRPHAFLPQGYPQPSKERNSLCRRDFSPFPLPFEKPRETYWGQLQMSRQERPDEPRPAASVRPPGRRSPYRRVDHPYRQFRASSRPIRRRRPRAGVFRGLRTSFNSGTGMMPSRSQEPSSRRLAQPSPGSSGLNSPAMASSTSRGVTSPITSPYSSTTRASGTSVFLKCSRSSMPVSDSGT